MSKIVLIFVGGNSFIDKAIHEVSKGDVTHVAGLLFDGTYESTGLKEETDPYPGVWLHRPNKYIGNPDAKFIEIEVPDIDGLKAEARRLLGTPYGYTDCLRTGIFDILGMQIPDNDWSMMCSETWTRLLHGGKVNILPSIVPGCIDPSRLYKAVMGDWNGQEITGQI